MHDPQAECPECNAKLGARPDCRSCGWKPTARAQGPSSSPDYVPPWRRPGWKDCRPEDRCEGGEDCTLSGEHTIRDHIEAFKRAGERIIKRAVRL